MSRLNAALVIAAVGLGLLASLARAENTPAIDGLLGRLERISQLQGEFSQRQYGDGDTVMAESSGVFRLLRPHYFSWEIRSPDRQLIVADAQYLWHYDIDLQTATRRPVAGNVEASPLQILGGNEAALRAGYSVTREGADAFSLVPVGEARSFRRLTVSFAGDSISGMDLVDKLGQRVVVDFSGVDATTPLSSADFAFTPPAEGVDLFYYDE